MVQLNCTWINEIVKHNSGNRVLLSQGVHIIHVTRKYFRCRLHIKGIIHSKDKIPWYGNRVGLNLKLILGLKGLHLKHLIAEAFLFCFQCENNLSLNFIKGITGQILNWCDHSIMRFNAVAAFNPHADMQ